MCLVRRCHGRQFGAAEKGFGRHFILPLAGIPYELCLLSMANVMQSTIRIPLLAMNRPLRHELIALVEIFSIFTDLAPHKNIAHIDSATYPRSNPTSHISSLKLWLRRKTPFPQVRLIEILETTLAALDLVDETSVAGDVAHNWRK